MTAWRDVVIVLAVCCVASSMAARWPMQRPSIQRDSNAWRKGLVKGPYRDTLQGGTLVTGCWNTLVTVDGINFTVAVDSGSSDLVLPGQDLPYYTGPRFPTSRNQPLFRTTVRTNFADQSSWYGRIFNGLVKVAGLKVIAPFAVAESQSENPTAMDGVYSQGLLGLAYDTLSVNQVTPLTFLTAMVSNRTLLHDRVALRGCPASSNSTSYIDWGAEDPTLTCPIFSPTQTTTSSFTSIPSPLYSEPNLAWAKVTQKVHHTVSVTKVSIDGKEITNERFQADAVVDSCTTLLLMPTFIVNALVNAVNASNVLQDAGVSEYAGRRFLTDLYSLSMSKYTLNFTRLPSFSLHLPSTAGIIQLTLQGSDYIQSDGQGRYYFPIQPSRSDRSMTLGSAFFDVFYVVLDREKGRVGFGPGCDCEKKSGSESVVVHYQEIRTAGGD
ncbi:aspartic peptidase domain-containing protein [Chytridium lagenaria]|nr:aspartic peptidase domain-containing protein [Chytridium lagenaria]